jgi:hypothetical protein
LTPIAYIALILTLSPWLPLLSCQLGNIVLHKFTPNVPRELQHYCQELGMLFAPAQVIDNTEKKKHACHYVDIITAELLESIPEFSVAISFTEFKPTIFKLCPGSESECK